MSICRKFLLILALVAFSNRHSEAALRVLSEDGCGRATAYSEFNKIVSVGGETHVSWLDSKDDKFLVTTTTAGPL